jgi:hypothetical protein
VGRQRGEGTHGGESLGLRCGQSLELRWLGLDIIHCKSTSAGRVTPTKTYNERHLLSRKGMHLVTSKRQCPFYPHRLTEPGTNTDRDCSHTSSRLPQAPLACNSKWNTDSSCADREVPYSKGQKPIRRQQSCTETAPADTHTG